MIEKGFFGKVVNFVSSKDPTWRLDPIGFHRGLQDGSVKILKSLEHFPDHGFQDKTYQTQLRELFNEIF